MFEFYRILIWFIFDFFLNELKCGLNLVKYIKCVVYVVYNVWEYSIYLFNFFLFWNLNVLLKYLIFILLFRIL